MQEPVDIELRWTNLRFDLLKKWNWYFEYRAAILKVNHPRSRVDKVHRAHSPTGPTAESLYKKSLASRKAQVTKAKNRLDEWLDRQRQNDPLGLFEPTENEHYQRAIAKVERKQRELLNIQNLSPDEYYKQTQELPAFTK